MSSRVRNYFSSGSAVNKAKCNICKREVSRGKMNKSAKWGTTSQRNHLRDNHPESYRELLSQEAKDMESQNSPSLNTYMITTVLTASQVAGPSQIESQNASVSSSLPVMKQLTYQESVHRTASWKNGENFTEANHLLAEWLCSDMLPYNIVASERFRKFVRFLRPDYKLPSEFYFRCTLIPDIYRRLKKLIMDLLDNQVEHCSVTLDVWTSDANNSYFSTTVHFIDEKWNPIVVFLGIKQHFPGSHTGENVAKMQDIVSLSFYLFFIYYICLYFALCEYNPLLRF